MRSRKVALILSFVYCGLGQVYRGKILKGIDFIIIYTLLIVSFFFSPAPLFLRSFGLVIILIMWLMGIVDAYIDDETFVGGRRWLTLQKPLTILSVVVISGTIITLLVSWSRIISAADRRSAFDAQSVAAPSRNGNIEHKNDARAYPDKESVVIDAHSLEPTKAKPGDTLTIEYMISNNSETMAMGLGCSIRRAGTTEWISDESNDKVVNVGPGSGNYSREFVLPSTLSSGKYNVFWGIWDSDFTTIYDSKRSSNILTVLASPKAEDQYDNSEQFSIQVAAFRNLERAEKFCDQLLNKGYPATIEYPTSAKGGWYRVLTGMFLNKQDAVPLAEKLREREGISYMIVYRRATDRMKLLQTRSRTCNISSTLLDQRLK